MEVSGWCAPRAVIVQQGIRNMQVLEKLMEYLYGDFAVTRALGDFSVKRYSPIGGSLSPLISDLDFMQMVLAEEDE
ncbi:unnamed protein product [Brassica rapa subsp. narinosa]